MNTTRQDRQAKPDTREPAGQKPTPNPAVPVCPAAVTGKVEKVDKLQTFANPVIPVPSRGILCPSPNCKSRRIRVTNTVTDKPGVIVRYRECEDCGRKFSTEEKPR